MFRRCINHFIKDIIQDDSYDTHAPTVPTSYLHQGPTIPPTSLNIQAATPTCLKFSTSSIISTSHTHLPPNIPPVGYNIKLVTPTYCNNSSSQYPQVLCQYQTAKLTSTYSNIQPSIPTSSTPSSNLEMIPPMPSTSSNIQPSTLTSISSMPTPPLASDLHCLHQPSSSPSPMLDTHCLYQPPSNPTPMPNQ